MIHKRAKGRTITRAFTLVELLAVVAIVAILVVLVVVNANKHIKAAQATGCAERLRKTGQGVLAYAADHQNRLPGPFSSQSFTPSYTSNSDGNAGGQGLFYYIWSYLDLPSAATSKLARVGVCPAAERHSEGWLKNSKFFTTQVSSDNPSENITCVIYPFSKELPSTKPFGKSYPFGINGDDPEEDKRIQPWFVHMVAHPSQLALLSELAGNLNNSTRFGEADSELNFNTHCNILFLDGHVVTRKKHQKIDPENPRYPSSQTP